MLATARLEYYRYPAALPTVELSSLKLDLYRRDFTINTLAVEAQSRPVRCPHRLLRRAAGSQGAAIRVLHNFSFVEDPTRVFRAIRFEQRFGFRIGKHTAKLVENTVRMKLPVKLSGRRLANELKLILSEEEPSSALRRLDEFGLLRFVHPQIAYGPGWIGCWRRSGRCSRGTA